MGEGDLVTARREVQACNRHRRRMWRHTFVDHRCVWLSAMIWTSATAAPLESSRVPVRCACEVPDCAGVEIEIPEQNSEKRKAQTSRDFHFVLRSLTRGSLRLACRSNGRAGLRTSPVSWLGGESALRVPLRAFPRRCPFFGDERSGAVAAQNESAVQSRVGDGLNESRLPEHEVRGDCEGLSPLRGCVKRAQHAAPCAKATAIQER